MNNVWILRVKNIDCHFVLSSPHAISYLKETRQINLGRAFKISEGSKGPQGFVEYLLALKLSSEGNLNFVVTLRQSVSFSNYQELNALLPLIAVHW